MPPYPQFGTAHRVRATGCALSRLPPPENQALRRRLENQNARHGTNAPFVFFTPILMRAHIHPITRRPTQATKTAFTKGGSTQPGSPTKTLLEHRTKLMKSWRFTPLPTAQHPRHPTHPIKNVSTSTTYHSSNTEYGSPCQAHCHGKLSSIIGSGLKNDNLLVPQRRRRTECGRANLAVLGNQVGRAAGEGEANPRQEEAPKKGRQEPNFRACCGVRAEAGDGFHTALPRNALKPTTPKGGLSFSSHHYRLSPSLFHPHSIQKACWVSGPSSFSVIIHTHHGQEFQGSGEYSSAKPAIRTHDCVSLGDSIINSSMESQSRKHHTPLKTHQSRPLANHVHATWLPCAIARPLGQHTQARTS